MRARGRVGASAAGASRREAAARRGSSRGRAGRRPTVVKIGGSLLGEGAAGEAALDQVAAAWRAGEALVLVHGGGDELSRWLLRLGIRSRFVDGQRVTGREALPVALMVLGGLVNRRVVEGLVRRGCPAIGLTGADGGGVLAVPAAGGSLGAVGRVVRVNRRFYRDLLAAGRLPVLASLAVHPRHGWLNVNADLMASALAAGLRARRLLLMTNVPGVRDGGGRLLPSLAAAALRRFIARGTARDGMVPKLRACGAALKAGVGEVVILGPDGGGLGRALGGEPAGTRVVRGTARPAARPGSKADARPAARPRPKARARPAPAEQAAAAGGGSA